MVSRPSRNNDRRSPLLIAVETMTLLPFISEKTTETVMQASVLKKLKADFLQFVPVPAIGSFAGAAAQSLNPRQSTVDHANEFSAECRRAVFAQTLRRFFSGKPGGVSIRFLRRFEPRHFAKVGGDAKLWF